MLYNFDSRYIDTNFTDLLPNITYYVDYNEFTIIIKLVS